MLERAAHPRYKTCGGGLIGASLAAVGDGIRVPVRDEVSSRTFTLRGKREKTRVHRTPMLAMVLRDEFDDELRRAAAGAGAVLREHCLVRGLSQQPDLARVHLAAGEEVTARVVVGADGSSGVSARHAGVRYAQVDLGLELEILVPPPVRDSWRGRILLDWGALPGSYAWVFPKDDRLTVGVIATRGHADYTRQYLRDFVARLGLAGYGTAQDSGHLTRCRADDSPVRKGRVLVAGDAAGLLEPCTREGISFALRSGRWPARSPPGQPRPIRRPRPGPARRAAGPGARPLPGAARPGADPGDAGRCCCSARSPGTRACSTPGWPPRAAGGRSSRSAPATRRSTCSRTARRPGWR